MDNTYQIVDNFVVDQDGVVLGEVVTEGAIASQEALEVVLERMADVESQLVALKTKHEAIIENCRKLEVKKASYLAYLRGVYSNPIEAYAKSRLEGQKSRTLTTPYGQVSFRTVKGGLKVSDKGLALATAHKLGMVEAIKVTEEFQISKLTDEQRDAIATTLPEGFEMVPDRESMSIKVVG
jgi:phosphoenolpyruvate synthase/pyruvate phosphate dikinase